MFSRKKLLFGLTGKIGSGKTISANYLCNRFGWQFVEYSFAKPLKEIAKIFGFSESEVYGTQKEKMTENTFWGISGREFLQKFGTDICRDILPTKINMNLGTSTIWIKLFELFMDKNKEPFVVVSDVRFLDEANAVKNLGGYIIKIEREDSFGTTDIHLHKSETELESIKPNVVLKNNTSDMGELQSKLEKVIYMANLGFLDIKNSTLYL